MSLTPVPALWAAGLVALVTYRLLPLARARSSSAAAQAALMQQCAEERANEWYVDLVRAFEPLARRLPDGRHASTARLLYWAQLAGAWRQWDELSLWSLCIALGVTGALIGFLLFGASAMAIVTAGLALCAPVMLLSGRAKRVQRRFLRELPEVVELLRLEVASGASLSQAFAGLTDDVTPAGQLVGGWNPTEAAVTGSVRDVAAGTGYVALWLRRVMRLSTGTGAFPPLDGTLLPIVSISCSTLLWHSATCCAPDRCSCMHASTCPWERNRPRRHSPPWRSDHSQPATGCWPKGDRRAKSAGAK